MSPPWSSLEEEHRSSIPMSPPPSSPPSHPMSPLLSSPEEEHPPSERATPEASRAERFILHFDSKSSLMVCLQIQTPVHFEYSAWMK
uniref:Uncharacterized protein n=1 Tax=Aegilops tauschii subsp. strangulata TaxID=200361 RepID=A0A453I200_AEGTS